MLNNFNGEGTRIYFQGSDCQILARFFENTCPDSQVVALIDYGGVIKSCAYLTINGHLLGPTKAGVVCPDKLPEVIKSPDISDWAFPAIVIGVLLYVFSSSAKGFKRKFL